MNFIAKIEIMLLDQVLDVQGQAIEKVLKKIDIDTISNVRIGKNIVLSVAASSKVEAEKKVKEACEKLLHNPVIETYSFILTEN